MLTIDKLTKSFGDKVIFDSLSLSFAKGSRTLITGQSGVGKTTLLRIIAGLETAERGSVSLGDDSVISFMFQEPRLFMWMNVHDNICSVLSETGTDDIRVILDKLGLGDEIYSMPAELSGGMQRRIALARALLFPADVYLFDEPFAGLDPETAKTAADVIFEYTHGKTVIIVSHDTSMLGSINTVEI